MENGFNDTLKKLLARSLWVTLGRRNVVRLGRFLSNQGRLDCANDMSRNGELLVQRVVLEQCSSSDMPIVFDVGANVGDWSNALLAQALSRTTRPIVHCFEPAPAAHAELVRRLGGAIADGRVTLVNGAASDRDGVGTLHVAGEALGINSLHARSDRVAERTIDVPLHRLDNYSERLSIERIALVKSDAEGHDLAVIRGAERLLDRQAIDVFQFEYNWRWIDSRQFLKDVFDLAIPKSYAVAKITPEAVEVYDSWHPELESFREANYLLLSDRARRWFPTISWWG